MSTKICVFEYSWGKAVGGSHMYLGVAAEALSLEHDVTILHQYDQSSNDLPPRDTLLRAVDSANADDVVLDNSDTKKSILVPNIA